jgi:hypothetical protein
VSTTYQIINVDVQIDAVSIGDLWESITVTLGTEQDNGAATVVCSELPGDASIARDLLIYGDIASGTPPILFNGEIVGLEWNNSRGRHRPHLHRRRRRGSDSEPG